MKILLVISMGLMVSGLLMFDWGGVDDNDRIWCYVRTIEVGEPVSGLEEGQVVRYVRGGGGADVMEKCR